MVDCYSACGFGYVVISSYCLLILFPVFDVTCCCWSAVSFVNVVVLPVDTFALGVPCLALHCIVLQVCYVLWGLSSSGCWIACAVCVAVS